jgi:hypothetical protein
MRTFTLLAGFAVAISLSAKAQTPPSLLASPPPATAKFTSGELWCPAMERYKKELYDRVYAQWQTRLKAHEAELRAGIVRVRLAVTESGKIRDLRILSAGASGRLKRLTLDAINHTDVAPPPLLKGQRALDCDFTFRLIQH